MMFNGRGGLGLGPSSALAVAVAVALTVASPAEAAELKPREEVAARIAETYGVEVLHVREVEMDGRIAYAVTVMNPGGNFNAAFQVNTLLADAATGDLIPVLRHRISGYDPSGAATYTSEADGMALRRRSLGD